MKRLSLLTAVVVLLFCSNALAALLLDEDFDYAAGWLTAVSGGQWHTWLDSSQDSLVLGSMLVNDGRGVPEVCTYFQNALPAGMGIDMTAEFDFFVHEEDLDLDTYFMIGGGNSATAEIDYNLWGFIIDWYTGNEGWTCLHLWDLDGADGGGDWGVAELAQNLALDTWYHVALEAVQTVADPLANAAADADGQFRVLLDGVEVMAWTNFANNSQYGVNSVDIYTFDSDPSEEHDFHAFDKIVINGVPEPGTMSIIGAGVLGLLALMRRKK